MLLSSLPNEIYTCVCAGCSAYSDARSELARTVTTTMDSTTQTLMLVAVAVLVVCVSRRLFKQRRSNLPPGPMPWPIIGSLHLMLGPFPHQTLAKLAQKYGPVMSIQLGQKPYIVATSPEAAKEFLKHQDAKFSFRPPRRIVDLVLPKDLVFAESPQMHRHLRKILVSSLSSQKRLDASKPIRTEELAHMLRSIHQEPGPVHVRKHLHSMASNILTRMMFNKRFEDQDEMHETMEIVEEAVVGVSAIHLQDIFNFIPAWFDPQGLDKRFGKLRARMDKFHANTMEQHKAERQRNPVSEERKTLLDVLLDQLQNKEFEITDEHIKGTVWDILVAGTNTTIATVEWALAKILCNSSIFQKVLSELTHVVPLTRTIQESDLPHLPYLHAIIKETFRLHPVVPLLLPHYIKTPTTAFGYDIKANTTLLVNVWGIGRDNDIWENALEFHPERFLEGEVGFRGRHFELIPFGAGRRVCVGMEVANINLHLQLASLLHAFEWGFLEDESMDLNEGKGWTMPLEKPLVLVAKPRLPMHLYA